MALENSDKKWRKNIDVNNQNDPFVRYLICYLLQDRNKSPHRKSEALRKKLRDNLSGIGLANSTEIEKFIFDQIGSSDFEKIGPSFVDPIMNEVQIRINEFIEAVISRVDQLLTEDDEEFISVSNKHIKDILKKIPVDVKWQLTETLDVSLFCDNAFTTHLDTAQEDDERVFRNQFEFSRWKEIENESLLFSLMENDNLDQLIADEYGNDIEEFILDDLDQLAKKEIEAIQEELIKKI